jgi:diacylglycerol kinase (ATP)
MATILLNGHAAGGIGFAAWRSIESEIRKRIGKSEIISIDQNPGPELLRKLEVGETFFIAAGGDGTVNYLLNSIAEQTNGRLDGISLGAIGIGSSNDYHKPFIREQYINGIHCKIDPERTAIRSVGFVLWYDDGTKHRRYWLNNASAGITAEANYFFNYPDRLLSRLKKVHTGAAIMYAAVSTILSYRNNTVTITGPDGERSVALTNLGVVINPHVSGSFRYDSPCTLNGDHFYIHTMENFKTIKMLYCLYRLSRGRFLGIDGANSGKARRIAVQSPRSFTVEYDGEVIRTNKVEFSIHQGAIRICS